MTLSHIYDTYAKTPKGRIMHFDVVLDSQDQNLAIQYAEQWLKSIGENEATINQSNCIFCHSAEAPPQLRQQINDQGYAIVKLEGCPA